MSKITADKIEAVPLDRLQGDTIRADKITTKPVTVEEVKLDPVVEINNLTLVLLHKIEKLGSTPDLIRASSHIRLAADAINQTTKK